jgi:hypothetical protein
VARVLCVQHNDGVQSGEENSIDPAFEGETAQQILERKANSHARHGWTVTRTSPTTCYAVKEYDLPNYPRRKERWFRIE